MAKSNVSIAISLLEKQLPMLGMDSEEGRDLHKALGILSKRFSGKKSEDIAPAELMQVMAAQPDAYKQQIMAQMGGKGAPTGASPAMPGAM